jgi:hypothetical protein
VAHELIVNLYNRGAITDTKAAIDHLHAELLVWCGVAIRDAIVILEGLDQLLGSHDVTRDAMADEQVMVAARRCPEVGVKREQRKDTGWSRVEVLGNDLCGLRGDPTVVLVHFLKGSKDKLLRLFEIVIFKVRHHFAYGIQVDFLTPRKWGGDGPHGV